MDALRRRIRHLLRSFARAPGFTAVAVITLAVGIGANAAIFSLINGVLLRPLPYPDSERLVDLSHTAPGIGLPKFQQSDATYLHYLHENRVFTGVAVYRETPVNLTGEGDPERLPAARVTPSLLAVLGVAPERGRGFTEEEGGPASEPVVLLGHDLWVRRFGADPEILGRTIQIDGVGTRVVGVLGASLRFPAPETALWLPLVIDPAHLQAGSFNFDGVARLAPGVTAAAAQADLDRTVATLSEEFPGDLTHELLAKARFANVVTPLKENLVGDVSRTLWVLLGSVAVILLVACANVANLFLVRAEVRQREVAVRTALGAGRWRVVADFLAESLVLAVAGGAVGLALAYLGLDLLKALAPWHIPRLAEIDVDSRVLAFTAAVSLGAGLLFGVFPAFRYSSSALLASLRDGGRGATAGRRRHLARSLLVVFQVALALVLLVTSGLLVRSFAALRGVDPGFDPRGVLTLRLALPRAGYPDPAAGARFYGELLARVRALPGVEAAGAVQDLPLGGSQSRQGTAVEDFPRAPDELPFLFPYTVASPGYFAALGIPLVAGRTFERADYEQPSGAVVVSAALAARLWPGGSALGKRLRPGDAGDGGWYTVVGVVGRVRDKRLEEEPSELLYYPLVGLGGDDDWVARNMTLAVRTAGEPLALADPVRAAVWALDPKLPIAEVRTLAGVVDRAAARPRFTMLLLLLAAGVSLALGAVGLYGVIAYVVSQRRQEIGVRMALGADRRAVANLVVGQGLTVAAVGVVLGLAGAFAVTRLLAALLFAVSPTDPATFALVPVLLLGVAALASYLPARRAAAVEPSEALRDA
jgi:putative ABC transport system permease protein